jgi:phospholipase C
MAVAACSSNAATVSPFILRQPQGDKVRTAGQTPIAHVVFVIQENRSFNNLFLGYPGATTQNYGYDTNGDKITLRSQSLATTWDIEHDSRSFFLDCDSQGSLPGTDCKMDGWNEQNAGPGHPANFAYTYVPRKQIAPYWTLAKQYVLGDETFASNLDASFIAHQYAVAAFANHSVDVPGGSWGCEGGKSDQIRTLTAQRTYGSYVVACYDFPTLGTAADKARLTWRYYCGSLSDSDGLWSAYQADRKVYKGPDWSADVINPQSQFLTDVASGMLANVTWVAPTLLTSDHPGLDASQGPAWVASIVDAVGKSRFWNSTAIFIMWDDWGGLYDPVQPVYEDYDGLGFRVPLLMVSAYAKKGYVTHVQYETASVLRFIEDNFGLPQLAAADARANDPATDAFDYNQKPRAFKKIPGAKPISYWRKLDRAGARRTRVIGDD